MSTVLVCVTCVLFAVSVFPFHIYNYVYYNSGQKYACINVGVFKFNFFNINTVKGSPRQMQVNGSEKQITMNLIKRNLYKVFNRLCVYKIVQLTDYGLLNEDNANIALLHSAFSTAIYKFIQINGNYCKLRNYSILNGEHAQINYYAKVVTIINLIVVAKIILILISEKINEQ